MRKRGAPAVARSRCGECTSALEIGDIHPLHKKPQRVLDQITPASCEVVHSSTIVTLRESPVLRQRPAASFGCIRRLDRMIDQRL